MELGKGEEKEVKKEGKEVRQEERKLRMTDADEEIVRRRGGQDEDEELDGEGEKMRGRWKQSRGREGGRKGGREENRKEEAGFIQRDL